MRPSSFIGSAECKVAPISLLRVIVLALMALSVIAWGTSYKTSFYKSLAEQGKVPAAKLCTRASEIAKSEVEASVHQVPVTAVHPPAISAELFTEVERHAHALPVQQPRSRSFLALRNAPALFFRPPPSI